MSRIFVDPETMIPHNLDEVTFNDELQTISSYTTGCGWPHSTIEQVENRKEYFIRKLKGK